MKEKMVFGLIKDMKRTNDLSPENWFRYCVRISRENLRRTEAQKTKKKLDKQSTEISLQKGKK